MTFWRQRNQRQTKSCPIFQINMTKTNIRPLPPILVKIAETELNENVERIPADLEAIKSWLDKQPHIESRRDDQFLLPFLRGCKYSLEKTKEKLDTYHTIKTACPELFGIRDPLDPKIKALLDSGIAVPLPNVYTDCSRIILTKPCSMDPNQFPMMDVMKASFIVGDYILLEDDYCTVAGVATVIDLKGMTLAHNVQLSATFIKKFVTTIQDAYPYRLKSFHFINAPKIFELIFKLFTQFLNDKLKKRVYIHNTLEDLHAQVPKHLLPEDYGGDLQSLAQLNSEVIEKIYAKRDWFLEDSRYKTNESKRTVAAKNADLLFGVEGSFRKLDFD